MFLFLFFYYDVIIRYNLLQSDCLAAWHVVTVCLLALMVATAKNGLYTTTTTTTTTNFHNSPSWFTKYNYYTTIQDVPNSYT